MNSSLCSGCLCVRNTEFAQQQSSPVLQTRDGTVQLNTGYIVAVPLLCRGTVFGACGNCAITVINIDSKRAKHEPLVEFLKPCLHSCFLEVCKLKRAAPHRAVMYNGGSVGETCATRKNMCDPGKTCTTVSECCVNRPTKQALPKHYLPLCTMCTGYPPGVERPVMATVRPWSSVCRS